MKKSVAVFVVVAILSFGFTAGTAHAADVGSGAANGALIGAGIGLVVGLVLYISSRSTEKTMDQQKPPKPSSLSRLDEGCQARLWLQAEGFLPQSGVVSRAPVTELSLAF